jgi:hypothetical protein
LKAALASGSDDTPEDRQLDGKTYKYGKTTLADDSIGLYFDPETKLLAGYETLDTESMLGDVTAQYILGDYRETGGIKLPHKITIRKGNQPYAEVQFSSAAVNDAASEAVFTIPEAANAGSRQGDSGRLVLARRAHEDRRRRVLRACLLAQQHDRRVPHVARGRRSGIHRRAECDADSRAQGAVS